MFCKILLKRLLKSLIKYNRLFPQGYSSNNGDFSFDLEIMCTAGQRKVNLYVFLA